MNIKKMMNSDLIDPKDIKIRKLKDTIEAFKKYDKERKEYYSKSMQRLGELESFAQEMEEDKLVSRLRERIRNQKDEITRLSSIIYANKYACPEDLDLQKIELVRLNKGLKENINTLNKRLREAKLLIDSLYSRLNKTKTLKVNETN